MPLVRRPSLTMLRSAITPAASHVPVCIATCAVICAACRMWGRFLGLAFLGPAAYFAARGWVKGALAKRLGLLGFMGGTQGLVGWWMVRSGLQVSHTGLAWTHRGMNLGGQRGAVHGTGMVRLGGGSQARGAGEQAGALWA